MLAARLVTMIENHAEQLTTRVVHELRLSPHTPSYHQLDAEENYARVLNVVSNLGEWLEHKSAAATEDAYRKLGLQRFRERIPLCEVVGALMLTKRVLLSFIQSEGLVDTAFELHQQVEVYSLISDFFDRAIYFTVLSYEEQAREAGKTAALSEPRKRTFAAGWRLGGSPHAA